MDFGYILKGGFLAGKRTYILGSLIAVQAVTSYLVGDLDLISLLNQAPEILGGLGLMTLRAGVSSDTEL